MHYKIPPSFVFTILRGGLKPIQQLSEEEFGQKVHEFKSVLDMHFDYRVGLA